MSAIQERNKLRTIFSASILAAGLASASAFAAVTVNDDGTGFVGKGDVQLAFGWTNADLQANVGSVIFRYAASGTAKWSCAGINPSGKVVTEEFETASSVSSSVGYDARKNKQGQITGFNLEGTNLDGGGTSTNVPGTCPEKGHNWQQQPQLVGEIDWEGSDEPTLQVSNDGGESWKNLPITY